MFIYNLLGYDRLITHFLYIKSSLGYSPLFFLFFATINFITFGLYLPKF